MTRAAAPALPLLDCRDELALAHPRGPGQAERLGEPLKLGQQHPGKTLASLLARAGRGCRTTTVVRVRPGAYRAGLRSFDLVTEVRGRAVKTFADLEDALRDNRGEAVHHETVARGPGGAEHLAA